MMRCFRILATAIIVATALACQPVARAGPVSLDASPAAAQEDRPGEVPVQPPDASVGSPALGPGFPGPVSSTGQAGAPAGSGSSSGSGAGAPPAGAPAPAPVQVNPPTDVSAWLVYQNAQYGFEVRYPQSLKVIAPPIGQVQPLPALTVWFQDAQLSPELATREPPQFTVDVYDNPQQAGLDSWFAAAAALPADPTRVTQDTVQVGGLAGIRITYAAQLAPNVVYYVGHGRYVYRFTPLGSFADQMLASVQFTP